MAPDDTRRHGKTGEDMTRHGYEGMECFLLIRNSMVLLSNDNHVQPQQNHLVQCVQNVGVISTFRDYPEYIWGTSVTGDYHDCLWRRCMQSTLQLIKQTAMGYGDLSNTKK